MDRSMLQRAEALQDELTAIRRDIHMHPELSFQERRTGALIAEMLRTLGVQVQTGIAKTGVIGRLIGDAQGPVVALRSDMDALPIVEANDVSYKSVVDGVMHACGHDGHIAMLLGAAKLLAEEAIAGRLPGEARFVFQPSEESSDEEGKSGARRMVEEGAMEGVAVIFGHHVNNSMPVGRISLAAGSVSASSDAFYATITGRGCHAAYPHTGLDPVMLTAQAINAIQGFVARRIDPRQSGVISVTMVHAGTATNIVPDAVEIAGTIRALSHETRQALFSGLRQSLSIVETLGGKVDLRIRDGYPPNMNDPVATESLHRTIASLLGANAFEKSEPAMGAEDFSFYSQVVPSSFYGLGAASDGEPYGNPHTPRFNINERCLPIGSAILAQAALDWLQAHHSG